MVIRKFYLFPVHTIQPKNHRRLLAALVFTFFCLPVFSQTNISGVVNSYHRVTEVIPSKACVRLNTVAGLGYGDRVMLVQMKGALISTANNATYGDTSSLNGAGNYEISTVCYVRDDSVFFVYMMTNAYSATDKVQLVRIPQYISARVTDTLKALPWNNTTGTGGILAIHVDQDLILDAPILADTMGYRGGANVVSNGTCGNAVPASSFIYNANNTAPQNGAFKGEGVAEVPAAQSGGKGAPANGGGGGNNHNNGGAGGANLTAGGDGGGNSSTSGCTVPNSGRRGKALSNYGGRKIFMGGGGGAGQGNNGLAVTLGGGHGGGIIFINATNLTGNGYRISANGKTGGPALSDGASGGGAGGTVIMNVANYTGAAIIQANGGDGGTENDGGNIGRCYGAGGGGSGGAIYFSGATPAVTVSVNGGAAGPEVSRDASCAAAILPGAGSAGLTFQNYPYVRSTAFTSNPCSAPLAADLFWFNGAHVKGSVILKWKMAQPETIDRFLIERSVNGSSWTIIEEQLAHDQQSSYDATDRAPLPGHSQYRLRIIKKGNTIIYSSVQRVYVPVKNDSTKIFPNPAQKKIVISGLSSPGELSLFDLSGKLAWKRWIGVTPNGTSVDLPSLSAGVYVVKVGESVHRLVIR